MMHKLLSQGRSSLLPITAVVLAGAIFVADTTTDLEIAVAVLYTVVVLMSLTFCSARGIILIAAGCMGLAVLSAVLSPAGHSETGVINCIISLAAVGATAFLVLLIQSSQKRLELERERQRQLQLDLAHMNRVNSLGVLTASLAHELNQPITAAITNANACLKWLIRDEPDLNEARLAATRIVKNGTRAGEIISHLRAFYKKDAAPERRLVEVNATLIEVISLLRNEAERQAIPIRMDLAEDLPRVAADRVQLQQVVMNLMLNGTEAMKATGGELTIKSRTAEGGDVMISVSDEGVGLPADNPEQIFTAFFTTKTSGMGIGLAICRSIIEAHGGRLWATPNTPRGAILQFTLPADGGRPA